MEQHIKLINALVLSQQPENLKKIIASKLIQRIVDDELSKDDCLVVLQQLVDWILSSDNTYLPEVSLEGFQLLAQKHRSIFQELCSPEFMTNLFSNTDYVSRVNLIGLVMTILANLRHLPQTNRPLLMFMRNLRTQLVEYLRQNGAQLDIAVAMAHLYTCFKDALPESPVEVSTLCGVIVSLLGSYNVPSQPDLIASFRRDTEKLSLVLPLLWDRWRPEQSCLETLNTVYVLLADSGGGGPAVSLTSVIEKVPQTCLNLASQNILAQANSESGEAGLISALSKLLTWLGMWPVKKLPGFVLDILERLSKERPSLLQSISDVSLAKTLRQLAIPVFRPQLKSVLIFLLYGGQKSNTTFLTLATEIPVILRTLESEGEQAKTLLEELSEAAKFLSTVHPSVPEHLTQGVLKAVYGSPSISEERKSQLASKAWGNIGIKGAVLHTSLSGRVGLINLGNTCYMNSVLQALYHSNRFRMAVLLSKPGQGQPILDSLQQVFIFLKHSKRSIYSPSQFLKIARPPWFETGRQQDCSEFLTHLLDSLLEEERALGVQDSQTSVIEVSESNTKPALMQDVEMKSLDYDSEISSVDNSSSDTLAHRQVDGVMEGITKKFANNGQELVSESMGNKRLSKYEAEEKSEQNLAKVKSSLSRWSTEENLSSGGANAFQLDVDLCDNSSNDISVESAKDETVNQADSCIQDSQSDSTDSGIQSVGSVVSGDDADAESMTADCLIHRIFGGRMETCYTCLTCQNKSVFVDWFSDLHLAVPQTTAQSNSGLKPTDEKILAQKETLKRAFDELATPNSSSKSGNIEVINTSEEKVRDDQTKPLSSCQTSSSKQLGVPDLIHHYLVPESLSGENQYQCDQCNMLRDAVKTLRLLSAPQYLNITLLRFKYDKAASRRVKIFTPLDYPEQLSLNVSGVDILYELHCIVVHSGYSSEGGHYYSWVKEKTGSWLVKNDSRVTSITWSQIKHQATTLSRDTPYLLFYQRMDCQEDEDVMPSHQALEKVIIDNKKYDREMSSVPGTNSFGGNRPSRNDDFDGGGSSNGCNDNFGQFGGGRCVF